MNIVKSIAKGIGVVLLIAWCLWELAWSFFIGEFPAWVNWLSGGSFVLYMIGLFAWMDYDATKALRAKAGK